MAMRGALGGLVSVVVAVAAAGCERKARSTPAAPVREVAPALATAGPVAPVPAPTPVATAAPAPVATLAPAPSGVITRATIEHLASTPRELLDMLDPHSGVVVAISTGCESDEGVDLVAHLCGAAARRTLRATLPALALQIKHARMFEDEDGPGLLACKADVCFIPATSECEPSFTLGFSPAGKLVRFVERDDWQAQEELQQAFTARIDALQPAACP